MSNHGKVLHVDLTLGLMGLTAFSGGLIYATILNFENLRNLS